MSETELDAPRVGADGLPPRADRSATFIGAFALAASVADRLAAFGLIVLIASIYGSSYIADRYFIASIGPLLLGSVLGQTLASSVLPLLVRQGGTSGRRLLATGFWLASALLIVATLAYAAVAALVARVGAPAGSTNLGPWLAFAPIVFLLGISGYLTAVLLHEQRYVWPPFRTAAASLGALVFAGTVLPFTHRLTVVALAVTAGYALSCGLLILETGEKPSLFAVPDRRSLHEFAALWRKAGVAGLSSLLGGQAFVLVERTLAASAGVGAVATISYARGIAFAPNVIGQAISTGVYPSMVRAHERNEPEVVREAFVRSLRLTLFLAIAFASYFALFGSPLTGALLQRGAFGAAASSETGRVLSVFALALAANLLLILTSRVFFAADFFSAALWCQGVVLVVYVAIALPLREALGLRGLALAFGLGEMAGALTGVVLAARHLRLSGWELVVETLVPAARRAAIVLLALIGYRVVVNRSGVAIAYSGVVHVGGSLAVLGLTSGLSLWRAGWSETERVKRVLRASLARVR